MTPNIVIRTSSPNDGAALERLAALDSSAPIAGPALIAEQCGAVRAAIDLRDGRAIADPFTPSADLVALLRVRAGRLRGGERGFARLSLLEGGLRHAFATRR